MRDAPDIYDYSRDPEVARHVLWTAHTSPSESRSYIRYMLRRYRLGEPSSWGIVLKRENRVIGTIGFMWIQEENASAEVGYSLGRAYWNQGIMTEALRLIWTLVSNPSSLTASRRNTRWTTPPRAR